MTEPAVVLDSGVVDLATADREFRWLIRDLVASGWTPLIPTVVLAEAITGRLSDAPANQTIHRLDTVDTDQAMARRAGILRFGCQTSAPGKLPSGIDAIVAAHAADAGEGVVFTTDPRDLRRLLIDYPKIRVEKP